METQANIQMFGELILPDSDLIVFNGRIRTLDGPVDTNRLVTAMVIHNGRIKYVGTDDNALRWNSPEAEVVDLKGLTVLPGFIESHAHPSLYGQNLLGLDCRPRATTSIAEVKSAIAQVAMEKTSGEWIRGWGWDESGMKDQRTLTRWDLDQVSLDNPVLLERVCGHMAVANTRALELAGIGEDTADPPGGCIERDLNGLPTGLLQESAQGLVSPPENGRTEIMRGLRLAQEHFLRWGVTTIHDMSTRGPDLQAYQGLLATGELKMRVRPWLWALDGNGWRGVLDEAITVGIVSGFGGEMLKVQGMKFMFDGSVGGRTAAVASPYKGGDGVGMLTTSLEAAASPVARALSAGLRVAIHGIGERAITMAIQAYDAAGIDTSGMRNRIEHCALPTEQNLLDMRRLELIAASSVGFLYELGDSYMANLGPERMKRVYPQKSFKEHGIVAPGNSDSPVTEGNPWRGIYAAVTRRSSSREILDSTQNITVEEALRSYTVDAAYASFEDGELGCLREGSNADFIVVSDDPFDIDPEQLGEIFTKRTYVNGQLVYSDETYLRSRTEPA